MGLQTVGRPVLSEGLAEKGRVQLLSPAFSNGRNQRDVLPAPDAEDGARLARSFTGRFCFRRERQPVSHAPETIEGYGQRPAEIFQPVETAGRPHRPDSVAA